MSLLFANSGRLTGLIQPHYVIMVSTFGGAILEQYKEYVALIILKAQINGYHVVFLVSAIIVGVGAFLAYFIGDIQIDKDVKVHVEA